MAHGKLARRLRTTQPTPRFTHVDDRLIPERFEVGALRKWSREGQLEDALAIARGREACPAPAKGGDAGACVGRQAAIAPRKRRRRRAADAPAGFPKKLNRRRSFFSFNILLSQRL